MRAPQVLALAILLCCIFSPALCVVGVDISQLVPVSAYTCLKNNGIKFAIPRAYCSYGANDPHINENLKNAKAVNLIADIYMFPCRGKSPTAQVDQMMSNVPASNYGMVWIDVETNPSPGCGWGKDYTSNCQFLLSIIKEIKAKGKVPGIYSNWYQWEGIFGSFGACTSAASQQIWYAHYDNNPSFSDFKSFGGWTKPNIKQYQGDVSLCGVGIDKNFYP